MTAMMALRLALASFLGTATLLAVTTTPGSASCGTSASLAGAIATCSNPARLKEARKNREGRWRYTVGPVCGDRQATYCATTLACNQPDGTEGIVQAVYANDILVGRRCHGEPQARRAALGAQVATEWVVLDWSPSALVVQPPDGVTLVNLPTNFFTPDTAPQERRVTLLGQQVSIEATPIRWTWHHGDGTTRTTTRPGAPYPRLDITHTYRRTLTTRVSLDTTYRGRYRVGEGPWTPITETVTIPGPAQPLRVVEATPRLVGP